jgi:hypothetical protein
MRVRTMVFSSSSRCLDGFELEEEVVGGASFVGVEDEPIGNEKGREVVDRSHRTRRAPYPASQKTLLDPFLRAPVVPNCPATFL